MMRTAARPCAVSIQCWTPNQHSGEGRILWWHVTLGANRRSAPRPLQSLREWGLWSGRSSIPDGWNGFRSAGKSKQRCSKIGNKSLWYWQQILKRYIQKKIWTNSIQASQLFSCCQRSWICEYVVAMCAPAWSKNTRALSLADKPRDRRLILSSCQVGEKLCILYILLTLYMYIYYIYINSKYAMHIHFQYIYDHIHYVHVFV